jgi:hypothetical protein
MALGIPESMKVVSAVIRIGVSRDVTCDLTMRGEFDPEAEEFKMLTEEWKLTKKPTADHAEAFERGRLDIDEIRRMEGLGE